MELRDTAIVVESITLRNGITPELRNPLFCNGAFCPRSSDQSVPIPPPYLAKNAFSRYASKIPSSVSGTMLRKHEIGKPRLVPIFMSVGDAGTIHWRLL